MKFSNRWYYAIGAFIYIFNLAVVIIMRLTFQGNEINASNPVQYIVSTTAAMI